MRLRWPIEFGGRSVEQKNDLSLLEVLRRMESTATVSSGLHVTPENAMNCTTVQGIVRALTNAIGCYPISVMQVEQTDGRRVVEQRADHTLSRLFRRPNGVQSWTEFVRMAMTHVALYGNFFALKGQGQTGPIAYLRPIEDPTQVAVDSVDWRQGVTYRVSFDGGQRLVPQAQILHISGGIPSADGVLGISPVVKAREAIGICLAAERLIAQLYGNNDIPTMALMGGQFKDEEEYKLWAEKFRETRGSISEGRGGTLLLPEGMEAKEMSFKPTDAQLLEMRKFQRIEIAQVYGVPPHKLADLERATFSNIEELSLEFVRDVAKPYVKLFEAAMGRDLLTDADRQRGHVIRFDMEEATEGKLQDRLTAYGKAHEIGAMSPNEIRERLGLNPRKDPGGDEYVTALNMRPANELPDDTEGEVVDDDDADRGDENAPGAVRAVR